MSIVMNDIRKSFGQMKTEILKGISEEIKTGEMVSITGRSGSGKSTLLYIISTLDKPTTGAVTIDGVDIASLNSKELHRFRNEKMGFVFQFHHLLPELTALENVLMPAIKHGLTAEFKQRASDLLKEFGLGHRLNNRPSELSGGEQQRVAIARSLIMRPRYLFADEPTGNLDSINGQAVMNFFKRINETENTTVIYVTHDIEFSKMSHRQVVLVDGRIGSD